MRKIIENIGWIFFDKIFRMAVGILVSIWIARYLGPTEFGILNYATIFPTVFAAFAGFGLTNVLMVEFAVTNDKPVLQQKLVQTGLIIKLIAGLLAYVVSCCLNHIYNQANPELLLLINLTGTVLILQSSDIIETYFQSHTKARLSVIVKVIAFGLASLVRIYALLTHRSVVFLVLINIAELIIIYVLIIVVYYNYTSKLTDAIIHAIDYQLIIRLMSIAWPIMFTEFFVFVYMKIDQFMIESLSTNRELGLYGAALRLSESWYFIAIAVNTSFYPKIADAWNIDKKKFYTQYQDLLNILVYISLILAIFVSLFSNQLIEILYGAEYDSAGMILSVHIWAGVFVFIGVGSNNLMVIQNLQKFVLVKTIIGAIINILLNFWLIPLFGALGASVSTLIAYGFSAYGMNLLYKPARAVFALQSKSLINFFTFRTPLSRQSQLLS